jgi:2-dehydro-3-deoxygluconokinase
MREIISIGECMVELTRRDDDAFDMRVGGDTFNTAIYLARLGAPVSYMTAVGDDPYSGKIIETAQAENVGLDCIHVASGRLPGLYIIETTLGERNFWYWRDHSPARELFELPGTEANLEALRNAGTIYLSGITLSLYSETGLAYLEEALLGARDNGATVAIDSNFRPAGWHRDLERARRIYARFWPHADIALPSFDDEQALWGDGDPSQTFERLYEFGVSDVCLKMAERGAIVGTEDGAVAVEPADLITPLDTTAAGDAFSAGYLWARLNGQSPVVAAERGNAVAGIVIQHPGAIAPADAMAQLKT